MADPVQTSGGSEGKAHPRVMRKAFAEIFGTFWLTFMGCGSVLFTVTAKSPVDILAVAIAFGLTVVTMAYAIGHVSGCHLNPAITLGLAAGKRFAWKDTPVYIAAQLLGALLAALALVFLAGTGAVGAEKFANGFAEHSMGGFGMLTAFLAEALLTFFFVLVIMGATAKAATPAMAGLAIGLTLALIHIVCIPITGTSVNPARSFGPAMVARGWALSQLWVFLVAPIVGGLLGGYIGRYLNDED